MNQTAPRSPAVMEAKPVKGVNADYSSAEWSGEDTSGIECVGSSVLVKMDVASGKAGSIHLTEDMAWKHTQAAETGLVVAVGESAFLLNLDGSPWAGSRPTPGRRVIIEKYAGTFVRGLDGELYRLMQYGCVLATFKQSEVGVANGNGAGVGSGELSPAASGH